MTNGVVQYKNTKSTKFKLENIDRSNLNAIEYYMLYNEMHPKVYVDNIPTISIDLDILCVLSNAKYLPDNIRKKWGVLNLGLATLSSLHLLRKLLYLTIYTTNSPSKYLILNNVESIIHQPIVSRYSDILSNYNSALITGTRNTTVGNTPYDYHYKKLNLPTNTSSSTYDTLKNQIVKHTSSALASITEEKSYVESKINNHNPIDYYTLSDDICVVTLRCMDNTKTITTYDELNKYLFTMYGDINI